MKIYYFLAVTATLFLIACNQVDRQTPQTPPIPKVQETELMPRTLPAKID